MDYELLARLQYYKLNTQLVIGDALSTCQTTKIIDTDSYITYV